MPGRSSHTKNDPESVSSERTKGAAPVVPRFVRPFSPPIPIPFAKSGMESDDAAVSPSASPSPSPSPSPPAPPSSALPPVPYSTPSIQTLTLALPIQHPRPISGAGGFASSSAGGGSSREDCWSEGATSVLIDAWGERYLELSRGNLRQKHWQEVADAVTSREGYTKAPKTDVQCKNRVDTLKKKYKVEKSKPASNWPFFHRLDLLLGPNHSASKALPNHNPNPNPSAPVHIRPPAVPQFPQRQRTGHPVGAKRPRSPPSISSNEESSDGFPPEPVVNGKKRKRRGEDEERKRMEGMRALTHAIIKFGQVYERMETSRLQQEMEMEKHRIEYARELEFQRMQFFMKMQVEFSQLETPGGMRHGRGADAGTSNFNYLNDGSDSNSSG